MIHKLLITIVLSFGLAACAGIGPSEGKLPMTESPLYGKFIWHDLLTDDVESARKFYAALFGWTFEDTERPGGGAYTLIISSDGLYVGGIIQVDDPGDGEDYSRWLGYFAVADVDEAVNKTRKAGGTIEVEATDIGTIARVAAIADPQGAVTGLIQSKTGFPADAFEPGNGHIIWNELITSADMEAGAFYSSLSGLALVSDEREGGTYLFLEDDGLNRAGIMQRPSDEMSPTWLTHFMANDPARSSARVPGLGGQVVLAPSGDIRGGRLALVTDPTGALFALSYPAEKGDQ